MNISYWIKECISNYELLDRLEWIEKFNTQIVILVDN